MTVTMTTRDNGMSQVMMVKRMQGDPDGCILNAEHVGFIVDVR